MADARSRFSQFTPREARRALVALQVILASVLISSFFWESVWERLPLDCSEGLHSALAVDYELYRDVTRDVQGGSNFYDALLFRFRERDMRRGSIFNWRPPTYAYLASLLPAARDVQMAVVGLALAAVVMAFCAEVGEHGPLRAAVLGALLVGVLRWTCDGLAFFAQEVWVAILFTISLSATALADRARERLGENSLSAAGWALLAVSSGLLALFCRELALPFCVVAGVVAWCYRRRVEAVAWFAGCGLFVLFLAWHAGEVQSRLSPEDRTTSKGAIEWVGVGGMGNLFMMARMNSFQYVAPNWVMAAYAFAALVGLLDSPRRHCTLAGAAACSYLAAFCLVGLDVNFYWGLMFAPLLPFGVIRFPEAAAQLLRQVRRDNGLC